MKLKEYLEKIKFDNIEYFVKVKNEEQEIFTDDKNDLKLFYDYEVINNNLFDENGIMIEIEKEEISDYY